MLVESSENVCIATYMYIHINPTLPPYIERAVRGVCGAESLLSQRGSSEELAPAPGGCEAAQPLHLVLPACESLIQWQLWPLYINIVLYVYRTCLWCSDLKAGKLRLSNYE